MIFISVLLVYLQIFLGQNWGLLTNSYSDLRKRNVLRKIYLRLWGANTLENVSVCLEELWSWSYMSCSHGNGILDSLLLRLLYKYCYLLLQFWKILYPTSVQNFFLKNKNGVEEVSSMSLVFSRKKKKPKTFLKCYYLLKLTQIEILLSKGVRSHCCIFLSLKWKKHWNPNLVVDKV